MCFVPFHYVLNPFNDRSGLQNEHSRNRNSLTSYSSRPHHSTLSHGLTSVLVTKASLKLTIFGCLLRHCIPISFFKSSISATGQNLRAHLCRRVWEVHNNMGVLPPHTARSARERYAHRPRAQSWTSPCEGASNSMYRIESECLHELAQTMLHSLLQLSFGNLNSEKKTLQNIAPIAPAKGVPQPGAGHALPRGIGPRGMNSYFGSDPDR